MHYFNNFKGFAQAELDLSQPLTILIGPNGSGKSNVIEAVELLSFINWQSLETLPAWSLPLYPKVAWRGRQKTLPPSH